MYQYITYFEIAAFIASISAWGVIKHSLYLRLFPLLFFIIVMVEVYEALLKPAGHAVNAWVYNVQVPAQHGIYLLILYYSIERVRYKKFIVISGAVFIAFTIISAVFLTPKNHFNVLSYCLGSTIIIIGIIIKFYEMLSDPVEFNFLKKPFFYILFACLLFNVGTLPYFSMGNWLYYNIGYKNTVIILANVMSVLNYVMYGTYTIAFIWMIRKKAYS